MTMKKKKQKSVLPATINHVNVTQCMKHIVIQEWKECMSEQAFDVIITTKMKVYLENDSAYDNHTRARVLNMLASDIQDEWITQSDCLMTFLPIEEVTFETLNARGFPW